MNKIRRLRRLWLMLLLAGLGSLTVACSSAPDRKCTSDRSACLQTVSTDPGLGSAATLVVVDAQAIDTVTGQPAGEYRRDVRVFQGQSLTTVATAAVLGGVVPAAVQGLAGYYIAQNNPCRNGGCGGGAMAVSISGANANANSVGYAGITFGQ